MGNRATNRDRVSWTVNGWTEEEKEVVRREYPVHGRNWDGWPRVLPGRTRNTAADMAHRLGVEGPRKRNGLKINHWTEEEKETVRREYPVHGRNWDGWVEVLPGRTRIAVADMAHSLGIKGPSEAKRGDEGRCGPWDL